MKACVICDMPLSASKQKNYTCHKKHCRQEYTQWCRANWDQLSPSNKYKDKYEAEFWEVTPEQREHYASFFALMRPTMATSKPKSCLKCGKLVPAHKLGHRGYRLCNVCHESNRNTGTLSCLEPVRYVVGKASMEYNLKEEGYV